jgi:DNA polymerase I-like protein with 3'-5' exonuclease and polymerase domains
VKADPPTVVDFETDRIQPRPAYPPKPVGVSIQVPGAKKPQYLAWGHPTGNNISLTDATRVLRRVWKESSSLLFHHGQFDLDVAETHLGLEAPPWDKVEDTMFLLFLDAPRAPTLALKPSAMRLLGIAPTEQEELKDWILANVLEARRKPSGWGAYISQAPGDLVGRYADGDVFRTKKIYEKLRPAIVKAGMLEAYDRERRLRPYFLANERAGLRVDMKRLQQDVKVYRDAFDKADVWLRKKLKAPTVNIDSNEELIEALLAIGAINPDNMLRTPKKGDLSTSKESLNAGLSDVRIGQALGYRSRMATCLTMFMEPWLRIGLENNGRIHTHWRQVRSGFERGDDNGARTGRAIAAEPNLLNLSKSFEDRDDGYAHPKWLEVPELPLVRRYILPDNPSHIYGHRDYNQQEFRLYAHFEDQFERGTLQAAYADNPNLDVHTFVQQEVKRILNQDVPRRPIKTLNFGMLYGMGIAKTAKKMGVDLAKAEELKQAQRKAVPGIEVMYRDMKRRAREGEPLRTWGGRLYFCEPPVMNDGRMSDFSYKMVNDLCQGSAADVTKEALIRYHESPQRKEGRFLVTVYDEINASMPRKYLKEEMCALKTAMESIEVDVFMKSDAKIGANWGELSDYADPA